MQGYIIENCVLYVVAALTIIGAFHYDADGYSWFGLVFLLMANCPNGDKSQEAQADPGTKQG